MIEIEAVDGVNLENFDHCMKVVESISGLAMYEQLAEEAAELAHAALKLARIGRGENPTPVTRLEVMMKVNEELSDLQLVCEVIGLKPDRQIQVQKLKRWAQRIMEARKGGEDV